MGLCWGSGSPLDLKLKSLGAQAEDLDALLQAVKRRVSFAAQDNVIRESDAGGQVRILLSGTTCSYKRQEDGGRSILSFQHAGDFCDLHRYVLPDLEPAMGVQALTDCTRLASLTIGTWTGFCLVPRWLRPSGGRRCSRLPPTASDSAALAAGQPLNAWRTCFASSWHAAKRLASVVLGCRSHRSMSLTPQAFPSCMSIERSRHCGL